MCIWSQKSLVSVPCPSLALKKAGTAPSPEQSCGHTRSCYCCTRTDLIPSRVSANFCSFSTQNIQCTQCRALRAIKKALLPLSILASTVAILFQGHWGQPSLSFLSLLVAHHTWLSHSMYVCTGLEMSSCWLQRWGRCPPEQTCSLQASSIWICPEDHLAFPEANVCSCTAAWPPAIQFTLHFTWLSLSLP